MTGLVLEDFENRVGTAFMLETEHAPEPILVLETIRPLARNSVPEGVRPPFALSFASTDERVFPQAIYRLRHADMGDVEIFLVPSGKDARGVTYQATFS